MNRLRYCVAWSLLHVALGIALVGGVFALANLKLCRVALRIGGVEEEKRLTPLEVEAASEPDQYSIDLTTWRGDDGSPVVELLKMTPERFSALEYTANAKHMTVETLLGEAVRQAVGV